MRHHLSGRQLSRNSSHRHAMFKNMATSLLRHETIRTTVQKAKELRRVVEPLITLAKDDTQAHRRLAFARLRDAEVVEKLFGDLGPRFKTRPGGYTRILRMMPRPGDNADMALMQLVELAVPGDAAAQQPADGARRRTRRRSARRPRPRRRRRDAGRKRRRTTKRPRNPRRRPPRRRRPAGAKKGRKAAAKKKADKKGAKKSRD